MHQTIQQLEHLLTGPGCCKVPFVVKTDGDLCTAAQRFTDERCIAILDYIEGSLVHVVQVCDSVSRDTILVFYPLESLFILNENNAYDTIC